MTPLDKMPNYSGTEDPRTFSGSKSAVSTNADILYDAYQEDILDTLTERMETLSNETGQMRSELFDRPFIYNVQLFDSGDEHYHLRQAILITVENYLMNDTFIASFPELEIFGEGNTESEAIANLKESLLDLYDELHEMDFSILGDLPKTWLRILDNLIEQSK